MAAQAVETYRESFMCFLQAGIPSNAVVLKRRAEPIQASIAPAPKYMRHNAFAAM
jgi:hypothetical protein